MGEIGVQPHKALIAGLVDPGDGVPCRRRRLAVDAQVALATAFDDGMTHVDRDILRLPAAQLPDLRGGKPGRGNAGLRRGGNAKRRRQLRLFSGQRDRIERDRVAAGQCPEIGENFARGLHGRHSFVRSVICPTMEGVAMAAIDPLTAGGVLLATAATDAVYVMFTSAVVARKRVPAATWSSVWYLLSSYAVISYTENWVYVAFAAIGSWLGAYASITFLHRPPGGPPVGAAPE